MKKSIIPVLFILATLKVYAQVEGTVRDPNEKGLPGILVIALDSASKRSDTVQTDRRGFYFFTTLKPGIYRIEVSVAGFDPAVYKRVIVKPTPANADAGDDTYYALRRDFILVKKED